MRPFSHSLKTSSKESRAVETVCEIKINSIPALIAPTQLCGVPKNFCTAFISIQSLITKPEKPSSFLSKSVTIFFDIVAGTSLSIAGNTMWEIVTALKGEWTAFAKGISSTLSSSARVLRTVGSVKCESTEVSPWPGKCFAELNTPPSAKPRII